QEDVDVVGLSVLSGAHVTLTASIKEKLKEMGGDDIKIIIGGVIPEVDHPKLKEIGVSGIFTAGSSIKAIAEHVREAC
ncbi:MAG TPA: methylmalonyl-CoA mutase, partial [Desulfobacteraceae bacterium]|nr:methylmalonyl-CoA mutase [Desulfobacteraceae bacterium]